MSPHLSSDLSSLTLTESDTALDLTLIVSALEASPSPSAQDIADELQSLAAIYDDPSPSLSLYRPPPTSRTPSPPADWTPAAADPLRLVLATTCAAPYDQHPLHLLLTIPPAYPADAPPLIQLQDLYLASFGVSDELFGSVLRLYMHDSQAAVVDGPTVEWSGGVSLFDGVEAAREMCAKWIGDRVEEKRRGEEERRKTSAGGTSGGRKQRSEEEGESDEEQGLEDRQDETARKPREPPVTTVQCPAITSSEPLMDRKSVFVGHAAKVYSVDEVQAVLASLLSNSKIARASHNMMAYQLIDRSGVRRADNDDDGETAAGSRLAQLLTLLDVPNVMVVVTRWYGGVHLGPYRFKDINLAARDALVAAGFLQQQEEKDKEGKNGSKGGAGGGGGGGKKK